MRQALLLGGTGAMGRYLAQELVAANWDVTITSRGHHQDSERVRYALGNAKDVAFLEGLLGACRWDVVVDFMVWTTEEFEARVSSLLSSTNRYVYLSSYRVFANADTIVEDSPKLLDVCADEEYLATDEYALAKARQEGVLRSSGQENWTIVRPTVTYAPGRFQLGTLETGSWLARTLLTGRVTPLPAEILDRQTTMTWGGDVARMLARLVDNEAACGEDYNVCTSRHRTWREVAGVYARHVPLKVREVSLDAFMSGPENKWQIMYDRTFDRVMDNSKVLAATGLAEDDLIPLEEGLGRDLASYVESGGFRVSARRFGFLDKLTGDWTSPAILCGKGGATVGEYGKYLYGRLVG